LWSAQEYTVNLNANAEDGVVSPTEVTVKYDEAYGELPIATRPGYTFDGWYKEVGLSNKVEATTVVSTASDHTLFAKWKENQYTIVLNGNGGAVDTVDGFVDLSGIKGADNTWRLTATYSREGTFNATLNRKGFTFKGWALSDGTSTTGITAQGTISGNNGSFTVTGTKVLNLTTQANAEVYLYAQWEADYVEITLNAGNGTVSPTLLYAKFGAKYSEVSTEKGGVGLGDLPIASRNGYGFDGWFTTLTAGNQITKDSVVETDSYDTATNTYKVTLYAHWSANKYNATLDKQGGNGGTSDIWYLFDTEEYYSDEGCTTLLANEILAIPSRDGYSFGGYYTASNGAGIQYVNNSGKIVNSLYSVVYSNITLYAKWVANSYMLTYDVNDGDELSSISKVYGTSFSASELPTPTKTGYDFVGWYSDSALTNSVTAGMLFNVGNANFADVSTADTVATIYAKWTPSPNTPYTIYYYGQKLGVFDEELNETNCSLIESVNGKGVTGDSVTAPVKAYTGFVSPEEQTKVITADGKMAIYYYYARDTRNLSLVKGKGIAEVSASGIGVSSDGTKVQYGATVTLSAIASAGYSFSGWTVTNNTVTITNNSYLHEVLVDVEITANATAVLTDYTIEIYQMNLSGGYETAPTKTVVKSATTDTDVSVDAATYRDTGFAFDEENTNNILSNKINGSGNTVFKIYYKRNQYKFDLAGCFNGLNAENINPNNVDITVNGQMTAAQNDIYIDVYYGSTIVITNLDLHSAYKYTGYAVTDAEFVSAEAFSDITFVVSAKNVLARLYFESKAAFEINYDVADGTNQTSNPTSYKASPNEQTIVLADPTRAGYEFVSWDEAITWLGDDHGDVLPTVEGTALTIPANAYGSIKLKAVWKALTYNITYVLDGGTLESGAISTYTIESTDKLPAVTKEGYSFKNWKATTVSGNWQINDVVNAGDVITGKYGHVTLTATWQTDAVEVIFNANKGAGSTAITMNINLDVTTGQAKAYIAYMDTNFYTGWSGNTRPNHTTGTVVKPVASRNGYVFNGWYTEAIGGVQVLTDAGVLNPNVAGLTDANGNWISTAMTGTQLYAQWTKLSNIEVTFDLNLTSSEGEDTSLTPSSKTVTFDETYGALAIATRTGYTFGGWFKDKSCAASTEVTADTLVSNHQNHTLYAKWTINQYTLTINLDGGLYGDEETVEPITQNYKSTYNLTNPTKTGYGFDGWVLEGAGSVNTETGVFTFGAGNATLTATWTSKTYTITLSQEGEGVTAGTSSVTAIFNSNVISESITNPTRTGYTFEGWTATDGGTDFIITIAGKYAADAVEGFIKDGKWIGTENKTIYAKWTANSYIISYVAGDETLYGTATGTTAETDAIYDRDVKLATNGFLLKGYTFAGWKDENGNVYEAGTTLTKPNFSSAVNGKAVLTATWTANKYNISVSGANDEAETIEVEYGRAYSDSELSFITDVEKYNKIGYNLTGFAEVDGVFVIDSEGLLIKNLSTATGVLITDGNIWAYANNLSLEANYSAKEYTLHFNIADTRPDEQESSAPSVDGEASKKIYYDQTLGQDGVWKSATASGYYFNGWSFRNDVRPVPYSQLTEEAKAIVDANKDLYVFTRGDVVDGEDYATDYVYVLTQFNSDKNIAEPLLGQPLKISEVEFATSTTMVNDKASFWASLNANGEVTIYATWIGRTDIKYEIYFMQEEILYDDTATNFDELEKDSYNQAILTKGQKVNYDLKTYKVVSSVEKNDALISDDVEHYIVDKYGFEGFSFYKYEYIGKIIQAEGEGVKTKIYGFYDRQSFNLTLSKTKGVTSIKAEGDGVSPKADARNDEISYTVKFDATVSLVTTLKVGYTFDKWETVAGFTGVETKNDAVEGLTRTDSFTMPATTLGVNIKAVATANKDTKFTVEYYTENIDDSDFSKFGESVEMAGETDTEIDLSSIKLTNDEGFTYSYYTVKSSAIDPETRDGSLNIEGDGSLVIKIYYTRNSYTLTINYVKAGNKVVRPAVTSVLKYGKTYSVDSPVVTGFEIEAGKEVVSGTMTASDTTINVLYTANNYTITYVTEGGEFVGTANVDYTVNFTIEDQIKLASLTKTGWSFTGWTVTAIDTDAYVDVSGEAGKFVLGHVYKESAIDAGMFGNVTLTANWTERGDIAYKINFFLMDVKGSYTDVEAIVVSRDDGMTGKPLSIEVGDDKTVLTVNGKDYSYDGFKVNETLSNLNVVVNGDGTTEFNVYFDRNQYSLEIEKQLGIKSVKVKVGDNAEVEYSGKLDIYYGENIKISVTMENGSSWEGYDVEGTTPTGLLTTNDLANLVQEVSMGLGNAKLIAKASTNSYTLTIDANGGLYQDNETLEVRQTYQSSYVFDTPTRIGYTFDGWTLESGAYGKITESTATDGQTIYTYTFGAGDDTVTAKWKVNRYEVVLNFNDKNFSNGSTFATIDKIKTNSNEVLSIVGGKLTLFAVYGESYAKLYTTIDGDDFVSFEEFDVKENAEEIKVERTGYVLSGWTTALENGTKVSVDTVCQVVNTTEVFATWNTKKFTLTISKPLDKLIVDVANATKLSDNEYEVLFDSTVTLTATTETGYHFASYSIGEDELSDQANFSYTYTNAENVTIVATAEANTYTIVYNANGGSGAVENTVATFDGETTLSSGAGFDKNGYTISGWLYETTGKTYALSSKTTDNFTSENGSTVTLLAVWIANTYKVVFDTNGGSDVGEVTATYDVAVAITQETTKQGWDFLGWSKVNGKTLADVTEITEENIEDMTDYLLENKMAGGLYLYKGTFYFFNLKSGNNEEITLFAIWDEGDANYEIEYYLENFDGSFVLDKDTTEFGDDFVSHSETVASKTNATATIDTSVTYKGFTLDLSAPNTLTEGLVLADGSLNLKLFYRRNVYTVDFKHQDLGVESATATTTTENGAGANSNTFKYNSNVTITVKESKGYRFEEIIFGDTHLTETTYSFVITDNMQFEVKVTALPFDYLVSFEFETLEGGAFEKGEIEDVTLSADVDTVITYDMIAEAVETAQASIVGFTYKNFDEDKSVLPVVDETDKAQVVVVRFSRNAYDLTLSRVLGVKTLTATENGEVVKKTNEDLDNKSTTYSVKYQAEVVLNLEVEQGYSFKSWSDEIVKGTADQLEGVVSGFKIEQMPAENKTIFAELSTLSVEFTIVKKLQNFAGDGWIDDPTLNETKEAPTGSELESLDSFNLKDVEGFTRSTFEQSEPIKGDGSSKVVVYYLRNSINVTIALSEGVASVQVVVSEEDGKYSFTKEFTNATEDKSFTIKYGATATISATATNAGYTLTGFNGGVSQDPDDKHYYFVAGAEDINIIATAENNKYNIVYNANGGMLAGSSEDSYKQENVIYNKITTLLENRFTKAGYGFESWNTASDGSGTTYERLASFTYEEIGDLTLYAQWTPIKYNVVYSPNGGEGNMDGHNDVVYDQEITLKENSFTRTGFTFAGWSYTDSEGNKVIKNAGDKVKNLTSNSSETVIINAEWNENSYNVAYNSNYTSIDSASTDVSKTVETVRYTEEFGLRNVTDSALNFAILGYEFVGWTLDKSDVSNPQKAGTLVSKLATGTTDDNLVTYYAIWKPVHYFIAFDANGGHGDMAQIDAIYGEEVSLPANTFTKTGYDFAGWALSSTGEVVYADQASNVKNLATTTDAVATLYAKWTATPYTITVNANNGTFNGLELADDKYVYTYTIEDNITLLDETNLTRRGYSLLGFTYSQTEGNWADRFVGSIVFDDLDENSLAAGLYGDVQLTASWSVNQYKLTINYVYLNGTPSDASDIPSYSTYVDFEGEYSVTTQEIAGYTPDKLVVSGTMGAEDIVETVTFSPNSYTIEFNLNNGVGSSQASFKYNDKDITSFTVVFDDIYANAKLDGVDEKVWNIVPTRPGYRFDGWFSSSALDKEVLGGDVVKILATTTLYAKWTAVETTYYVDFKFEILDGSDFEIIETLQPSLTGRGISDTMVTEAMVKALLPNGEYPSFAGYNFKNVVLGNINANGDSRIVINYERKYFRLSVTKGVGVDRVNVSCNETLAPEQDADFYFSKLEDNLYQVRYGATITLEAVIDNSGYAFDSFVATGATLETTDNTASFDFGTTDVTVLANAVPKHYTITFNGNGGQILSGDTTYIQQDAEGENNVVYMKDVNLVANRFTRTGYNFAGWAISQANANAKVVDYADLDTYKMTEYSENVDLFAVWTPIPYRIILEGSNGVDTSKATIVVGDTVMTYVDGVTVDFDSVVKIYYTYTNDEGQTNSVVAGGYDFANFEVDGTVVESEKTYYEFTLKGETVIKLNATARTDTKFVVKYTLQNLDDEGYTEVVADRQTLEGETDRIVDYNYLKNVLNVVNSYEGYAYSSVVDAISGGTPIIRYHNDDKNYSEVEIRYVRLNYDLTLNSSVGVQEFFAQGGTSGNLFEVNGIYKVTYGTPADIILNMYPGYTFDGLTVVVSMMEGSVALTNDGKTSWQLTEKADGFYFGEKLVVKLTRDGSASGAMLTIGDFKLESMPAYAVEITTSSHANDYEVTYHRNLNDEDAESDTDNWTYGQPYDIKNIKTLGWNKAGYEFVGWATSKENADKKTPTYTFADDNDLSFDAYDTVGDLELWAVWAAIDVDYTIEYYFEKVDGTYELKEEHTAHLKGKTDSTANHVLLNDSAIAGFEFDEENANNLLSGTIKADGSLTLKVYYSRLWYEFMLGYDSGFETVSITVDENNIKNLINDTEKYLITASIKYGATVSITKQVKEGYEYVGMTTVPAGLTVTNDSFEMPISNVSISMTTKPMEFTLTFKTEFGGYTDSEGVLQTTHEQKFTYLTKQKLWKNQFERSGFVFLGWSYENADNIDYVDEAEFEYNIARDIEFVAVWEANRDTPFTVNYYLQKIDGTTPLYQSMKLQGVTGEPVSIRYVEEGFKQLNVEHKGYKFVGLRETDTIVSGDGSTVVSAEYALANFNASFDFADSLAVAGIAKVEFTYGSTSGEVTKTVVSGSSETVQYNAPLTISISFNDGYKLKSLNATGKTFSNVVRYPDADGNIKFNMPAEDIEITIEVETEEYQIKFFKNFKNDLSYTTQDVRYLEENVKLSGNYIEVGYQLLGWATATNGAVSYAIGETIAKYNETQGLELYAVWQANSYTIAFSNNGGSETIANIITAFDTVTMLPNETTFRKTGYQFVGWSTNPNTSEVINVNSDSDISARGIYFSRANNRYYVLNLANGTEDDNYITLYAIWSAIKYNVTLSFSETSTTEKELGEFTYDQDYTVQPFTTLGWANQGYTFQGWYYYADGGVKQEIRCGETETCTVRNLSATKEKDVRLYAIWGLGEAEFTIRILLETMNGNYGEASGQYIDITGNKIRTETLLTSEYVYNQYLMNTAAGTIEGFEYFKTYQDSQTVLGDGTTVIKVQYARRYFSLIVNLDSSVSKVEIATEYNTHILDSKLSSVTRTVWSVLFGDKVTLTLTENQGYKDALIELVADESVQGVNLNGKTFYMKGSDGNKDLGGNITINALAVPRDDTEYSINIFKQALNLDYANLANHVIKGTGRTGSAINSDTVKVLVEGNSSIDFTGFTFASITLVDEVIKGDGSSVVNVFYTRERFEVSASTTNTKAINLLFETAQYLYQESALIRFRLNKGYSLDETTGIAFYDNLGNAVLDADYTVVKAETSTGVWDYTINLKTPAKNVRVAIVPNVNTNTEYTIEYKFQSLNLGNEYESLPAYPAIKKTGRTEQLITNADIDLEALQVEGFTADRTSLGEEGVEIAGDGSTVITIYFNRIKKNVNVIFVDENNGYVVDSFTILAQNKVPEVVSTMIWSVGFGQTLTTNFNISEGFTFKGYQVNGNAQTINVTGRTMTYVVGSADDINDEEINITITIEAKTDIVYTLIYYAQSYVGGQYTYGDPVLTVTRRGTANAYLSKEYIQENFIDGLPSLPNYREENFKGVIFGFYTATMYGNQVDNSNIFIAGDRSTTIKFYYTLKLISVKINEFDDTMIESIRGEGNYAIGEQVTISANPKKGYKFVSWDIIKGGDVENKLTVYDQEYTFIIDDDVDITLNVEADVSDTTYTVEYYLEVLGQTDYQTPFLSEVKDGVTEAEVNIAHLIKDFDGYQYDRFTCNNNDNIIYGDGTTVVKLYYLLRVVEFEVRKEAGIATITVEAGNNETPLDVVKVDIETGVYTYRTKHTGKVSLSVTLDKGRDFQGWRKNGKLIQGSNETVGYLLDITYDTQHITASSATKQVIIIYEPNNGTSQSRTYIYNYGDVAQLINSPFTNTKKATFLGWSTSPDGDVVYFAGDTVKIDEFFLEGSNGSAVTLYAVWRTNGVASRWWIWLLIAILIILILILMIAWIIHKRRKHRARMMAKQ